jgi:hypothetical protein
VTELGADSCIHSVASISSINSNIVDIWCGLSQGAISVFTLTDGVVTSQKVINHNDPIVDNVEVLQVVTESSFAWTYLYPGCHVYQWETQKPSIKNRLDCSKLVPCSESLKTIAIDEHFSPGRCQVASMTVHNSKLNIGTSWGCLIITEADTLRPITVFRPFSDEVQAIVAIRDDHMLRSNMKIPNIKSTVSSKLQLKKTESVDQQVQQQSLIVTLGKGYRGLIERYVTSNNRLDDEDEEETHDSSMMYALLWRPDDWLAD